jgi:hypothetical protein
MQLPCHIPDRACIFEGLLAWLGNRREHKRERSSRPGNHLSTVDSWEVSLKLTNLISSEEPPGFDLYGAATDNML